MQTIIELEVNPQQERLLKEMLTAMNIDFKSKLVKEKEEFSEKEISEAVQN